MKLLAGGLLLAMAFVGVLALASRDSSPAAQPIIGTWRMVSYQYGSTKEPVVQVTKDVGYKTFSGTRWSAAAYNVDEKKFIGAGGGTYTLKGDQYVENVEYYSWGSETVGKSLTFKLTIENGRLHQKGFMEWKGNKEYVIDEWYEKVE